ncbi:hypothetical protein M430DRAFT_32808 [Amorphotheca resinae ATCC 22711]|uniref:Phospholipase/carboxylesterase/thioesterase domain-containing protein n=1 Tax=Amorphotheca resinae ATCC 22711 TaxID=857342 RepID=A0A2T3BGH1_AMORE|nr:hypothetical protein M430DRAFT_32808 [Amorphotheca resinae ATCC 22711]PSS28438.1 hypothetical protein M430DRAFT_32808 [Amorphotheca resinae ATCC 22711]
MTSSPPSSSAFPTPHTILPAPPHTHTNTLILLHGTSANGPSLSASLQNPNPPSPTPFLPSHPTTKLLFPTGRPHPTTVFQGRETNAWFDIHSFQDRTLGDDSLVFRTGMRDSVRYLARLIKSEIEGLDGAGRLVLGGFSQGCALGVVVLLSGELERCGVTEKGFGGFVGLSGWLPLWAHVAPLLETQEGGGVAEGRVKVRRFLRRYLGLDEDEDGNGEGVELGVGERDELGTKWLDVPVFLGHGLEDEKVKYEWGQQMADVLLALEMNVQRKAYAGLAHWWCAEEMGDIDEFLKGVFGKER